MDGIKLSAAALTVYEELERQFLISSDPEAYLGPIERAWKDGVIRVHVDGYIDLEALAVALAPKETAHGE